MLSLLSPLPLSYIFLVLQCCGWEPASVTCGWMRNGSRGKITLCSQVSQRRFLTPSPLVKSVFWFFIVFLFAFRRLQAPLVQKWIVEFDVYIIMNGYQTLNRWNFASKWTILWRLGKTRSPDTPSSLLDLWVNGEPIGCFVEHFPSYENWQCIIVRSNFISCPRRKGLPLVLIKFEK